jgi:hypothetical protein
MTALHASQGAWAHPLVWLTIGLVFICAMICLIASLIENDRTGKRDLSKFDARVGRDVYRDIKGITK